MPGMRGYGKSKHITDRTKNPGKVTSGKVTASAYGPQQPLGTISMAPRKKEKARGY